MIHHFSVMHRKEDVHWASSLLFKLTKSLGKVRFFTVKDNDWQRVEGVVVRGHGVASGAAAHSPYPRGTIELQTPFFKALGLDLALYAKATLNVSISPCTFEMGQPELTFRQVEWTSRHPPEDFSFSRCRLWFQGSAYPGWVYYPHPETKKRNFQPPSILEIIAPQIANIGYGDGVEVDYNPAEIIVSS